MVRPSHHAVLTIRGPFPPPSNNNCKFAGLAGPRRRSQRLCSMHSELLAPVVNSAQLRLQEDLPRDIFHHDSVSTQQAVGVAATGSALKLNLDSDSDSSELSELSSANASDTSKFEAYHRTSFHNLSTPQTSTDDKMQGVFTPGKSEALNETSESDSDVVRPTKRLKLRDKAKEVVTSALTYEDDQISSSTNRQTTTPSLSSQSSIKLIVTNHSRTFSSKALPPLLSPKLPPVLEKIIDGHNGLAPDQDNPEKAATKSLRMVIVSKSDHDTLKAEHATIKSHNSILRSHNLSLARQNTGLIHDKAEALTLLEEWKDKGPMDHNNCVSKEDYNRVIAENEGLRKDVVRHRTEYQLWKECGMEWARRENLWEIEERLLKKEVTDLVSKVELMAKREEELVGQMRVLEGIAQQAEAKVRQEMRNGLQAQQHNANLRGFIHRLQTRCAELEARSQRDARSVYPEL